MSTPVSYNPLTLPTKREVLDSFVALFIKQTTAYDVMPSLVGSEMCIRDRGPRSKSRPGQRIAQHAGAEAMDNVYVARLDQAAGQAPGAHAEQRIGGAAIENGRAASAREREGRVRDEADRQRRTAADGGGRVLRGDGGARGSRDQVDPDPAFRQVTREIRHVTLEPAVSVQRVDGARHDRDAQLFTHGPMSPRDTRSRYAPPRGPQRSWPRRAPVPPRRAERIAQDRRPAAPHRPPALRRSTTAAPYDRG